MTRIKLGLIGDNIASSSSPLLHESAGRLCGLDVGYERLVPRELGADFDIVFEHCRDSGFRGVNVTYPYKERAAKLVHIEDALVRSMGAVNTVVFGPDGPSGFNTDHSGFIAAYRTVRGSRPPGEVSLVGAGGVGKAVAFGLAELGTEALRIVEHDTGKAYALAESLKRFRPGLDIAVADRVAMLPGHTDGWVNCTPVGMVGHEGSAIPGAFLQGARWAFDAVYTPARTQFLMEAEAAGLDLISGYELFFHQGVKAFEIFCGREVDQAVLREALLGKAVE
jgi:shikimate dehydrogenase